MRQPVAFRHPILGGSVKAVRASPQARHHFTCFDQVNQIVGASEAVTDLCFIDEC